METPVKKSIIQDLWDRKVPQYLGTYFAVGFGLLQFVEFLTKRYDLTSSLIDKYLLIWLTLFPTIIILAYFGDELKFKSGPKWPKRVVIANVLVAFSLSGILFNEPVIGQSSVVQVVDEEGKSLTALVPEQNKVKTIANFQFRNLTGDKENDWYGVAFSQLLQGNLHQRPEFYCSTAYALNTFHEGLGLPPFETPNIGMQREIAKKSRNDYFTDISYNIKEGQFIFEGNLYSTRDGKSVVELKAVENNPYTAIDKLKEQIVQNIPNAVKNDGKQMNMPASSLITRNLDALKLHTLARMLFYKKPSALEETLKLEKEAIALDPQCASCHFWKGDVLYGMGRKDEGIAAIKQSIIFAKSLPERMQFVPKEIFYQITNNMEAYRKLQEMRKTMYPYDFAPYQALVELHRVEYGIDGAKKLMREAIDNGIVEQGLLGLYQLQLENEEYEQALSSLERLTAEFPDRDEDRQKYAHIYTKQGRLEKAKEVMLQEEALNPLNPEIQVQIALLDIKKRDLSSAHKRLDRGLLQATTLTDSINFLYAKFYVQSLCGEINSALQSLDVYEKHAAKMSPINRVLANTILHKLDMYLSIGKPEQIKKTITEFSKYSPEYENLYYCNTTMRAMASDYDLLMNMEEFQLTCAAEFKNFGAGYETYFDLMMAYQSQEFAKCIELLEKDDSKIMGLVGDKSFISTIYAKAGDLHKAKEILKKEIDQKTEYPVYYCQMAKLLENENPKSAKKHLDIALQYWTNADANFIPYQRALALSERLGEERIRL